MKEIIEEIRMSRLHKNDISIINYFKELKQVDNLYYYRGGLNFIYHKSYKILEYKYVVVSHISGYKCGMFSDFLLNKIREFNLFPDLEIENVV